MRSPCVDCGELTAGTRCPACLERRAAVREVRLPNRYPEAQGYNYAWRKLSRRARKLQPFCSDCGTASNLECDHSPAAWERVEAGKPLRLEDVDVVCHRCNVKRGAARGPGAEARAAREAKDPARRAAREAAAAARRSRRRR